MSASRKLGWEGWLARLALVSLVSGGLTAFDAYLKYDTKDIIYSGLCSGIGSVLALLFILTALHPFSLVTSNVKRLSNMNKIVLVLSWLMSFLLVIGMLMNGLIVVLVVEHEPLESFIPVFQWIGAISAAAYSIEFVRVGRARINEQLGIGFFKLKEKNAH